MTRYPTTYRPPEQLAAYVSDQLVKDPKGRIRPTDLHYRFATWAIQHPEIGSVGKWGRYTVAEAMREHHGAGTGPKGSITGYRFR